MKRDIFRFFSELELALEGQGVSTEDKFTYPDGFFLQEYSRSEALEAFDNEDKTILRRILAVLDSRQSICCEIQLWKGPEHEPATIYCAESEIFEAAQELANNFYW